MVEAGITLLLIPVVPSLQVTVPLHPVAVKVVLAPLQIVAVPVIVGALAVLTLIAILEAVLTQLLFVQVALYVVFVLGETVFVVPVPKLLSQVTVPLQLDAVKVADCPRLIVLAEAVSVGAVGIGFTVTVTTLELTDFTPLTVQVAV